MHVNDYALLLHAQERLEAVPLLHSTFKRFPISEPVNGSTRNRRWAGLYPGMATFEPKNIGGRWQRTSEVRVILQMVAGADGYKLEQQMAEYANAVLAELVPRDNWGGLVELVNGFTVDPGFREASDKGGALFRESVITISANVFTTT